MVMNMNNKNWVSVWGNAVSIAEHHPEAYAKYITLRYPVYIPFDGDTLRFTFDNYCGSEAVTVTRGEAGLFLPKEPLFLQPLPLFMKKCRSPVHAKRKRSATSLFQKTSP